MVAAQHQLTKEDEASIDSVYQKRARTLFSVDDLVAETISLLGELGIDKHTYVMFTSDHGFHLGQFNLGIAKRQVYDTDVRVPFMVRGPGLKGGSSYSAPSSHVDLSPTILDMAKIPVPLTMDGVSLLPPLAGKVPERWRKHVFVEFDGAHGVGYDMIGKSVPHAWNTMSFT